VIGPRGQPPSPGSTRSTPTCPSCASTSGSTIAAHRLDHGVAAAERMRRPAPPP
jgi:hypothetical protein